MSRAAWGVSVLAAGLVAAAVGGVSLGRWIAAQPDAPALAAPTAPPAEGTRPPSSVPSPVRTRGGAPRPCGAVCTGKSPEAFVVGGEYRCTDDAVTLGEVEAGAGGFATLRYSPTCRTAWVRGQAHAIRVRGYRPGGVGPVVERSHQVRGFSEMVNADGLHVEACFYLAYGIDWTCTKRVDPARK